MMVKHTFVFDDKNKERWVERVNSIVRYLSPNVGEEEYEIEIRIQDKIKKRDFTPFHIVLLPCLVAHIEKKGYNVTLIVEDKELFEFINNDVNITEYINNADTVYVKESNEAILNLWKIVDNRAKEYTIKTTEYLQRTYFKGLDLSGLQNSLDEIYANVADHSKADGIAFSYITYDEEEGKIHFAVCDFGLGIPATLRAAIPEIESDETALRRSLDIGVSARTNTHNRGFGLDNVLSNLGNGGMIRIVSNKALLFCQESKSNIKTYPIDFDFKGTLIYFDISMDSFEKDEELEGDIYL